MALRRIKSLGILLLLALISVLQTTTTVAASLPPPNTYHRHHYGGNISATTRFTSIGDRLRSNPFRRASSSSSSSSSSPLSIRNTKSLSRRTWNTSANENNASFASHQPQPPKQQTPTKKQTQQKPNIGNIRVWNGFSQPRQNQFRRGGRKRPSSSWTSKLVTTNVAVFALQKLYPQITPMFTKRSELILAGRELHRLFTPMFLHGGFAHLLMNTYSLNNVGPQLEHMFGGGRFLATYLLSGVAGNLCSAIYTPNPSLGASGAVFGCMGAYFVFLNRNGELFGQGGKMQMRSITQTLMVNLVFGFRSPNIDNWGHIGGALGGAFMASTFGPKLYVMGTPDGRRMVVDNPTFRLPRYIEQIPEQTFDKIGQTLYRVEKFGSTITRNRRIEKRRKRLKSLQEKGQTIDEDDSDNNTTNRKEMSLDEYIQKKVEFRKMQVEEANKLQGIDGEAQLKNNQRSKPFRQRQYPKSYYNYRPAFRGRFRR